MKRLTVRQGVKDLLAKALIFSDIIYFYCHNTLILLLSAITFNGRNMAVSQKRIWAGGLALIAASVFTGCKDADSSHDVHGAAKTPEFVKNRQTVEEAFAVVNLNIALMSGNFSFDKDTLTIWHHDKPEKGADPASPANGDYKATFDFLNGRICYSGQHNTLMDCRDFKTVNRNHLDIFMKNACIAAKIAKHDAFFHGRCGYFGPVINPPVRKMT